MSFNSNKVEQLNADLYVRLAEEQRIFVEELKAKTPEEILKGAYEYIIREDFLAEMEFTTLRERQAKAMLESKTPMSDLYRRWMDTEDSHMQDIRDTISSHSKDEADRLGIKDKSKDRDAR